MLAVRPSIRCEDTINTTASCLAEQQQHCTTHRQTHRQKTHKPTWCAHRTNLFDEKRSTRQRDDRSTRTRYKLTPNLAPQCFACLLVLLPPHYALCEISLYSLNTVLAKGAMLAAVITSTKLTSRRPADRPKSRSLPPPTRGTNHQNTKSSTTATQKKGAWVCERPPVPSSEETTSGGANRPANKIKHHPSRIASNEFAFAPPSLTQSK